MNIIKDMAMEMEMDTLIEEYEKTRDPGAKKVVVEVLRDRSECPSCSGDLLMNKEENSLYCPVDGSSVEL